MTRLQGADLVSDLRRKLAQSRSENDQYRKKVDIFRRREQEFDERFSGPPDAEGMGGRPAVPIFRDKNLQLVYKMINDLATIAHLRMSDIYSHADSRNDPELGFLGAVDYAVTQVGAAIDAMWLEGPQNPLQARDYHRAKGMLSRPFVFFLLRPDEVGFYRRLDLKEAVEQLGFAPSVRQVFASSRETPVDPIEAERKGFAD